MPGNPGSLTVASPAALSRKLPGSVRQSPELFPTLAVLVIHANPTSEMPFLSPLAVVDLAY